jgi:hypothetical protein
MLPHIHKPSLLNPAFHLLHKIPTCATRDEYIFHQFQEIMHSWSAVFSNRLVRFDELDPATWFYEGAEGVDYGFGGGGARAPEGETLVDEVERIVEGGGPGGVDVLELEGCVVWKGFREAVGLDVGSCERVGGAG